MVSTGIIAYKMSMHNGSLEASMRSKKTGHTYKAAVIYISQMKNKRGILIPPSAIIIDAASTECSFCLSCGGGKKVGSSLRCSDGCRYGPRMIQASPAALNRTSCDRSM